MKIDSTGQAGMLFTGVKASKQAKTTYQNVAAGNSSAVNISATAQSLNSSFVTAPLPTGVQNMLQSLVNNPQQWKDYVKGYAGSHSAAMTINQFLTAKDTIAAGQQKLKGVLNSSLAQGKSPAQCMADVLSYELTLPQGYWDAMNSGTSSQDLKEFTAAKLAYLQQCIAAHNQSSGS